MTRMRPIGAGEKSRIRDSWDSLLGSESGLGTSIIAKRNGANRTAQSVRAFWLSEGPEAEAVPQDVAVRLIKIVGDLTLDLRAGDTFPLGGRLWDVIQGAAPEIGSDWNKTALARLRL